MRPSQRLCASACTAVLATTLLPAPASADGGSDQHRGVIAFSRFDPDSDSFALWRARPDGSHLRQLTPGAAFFPAWSPDLRHLVFDFTDADGNEQIGVVRRDGSHLRQLTDLPGISEVADFSPDGDTLVFDRSPLFPDDPGFFTSLWQMDVDGSRPRPLFEPDPAKFDVEPRFSPNGKSIVFARLRQVGSVFQAAIFVVDTDGSHERQVTRFQEGLEHPRWSPDGRRIVFDIELPDPADPASGIWQVGSNGVGQRQVLAANSRIFGFKPDFSPDGKQILFGCFILAQDQDDLCVMRADGSHVRNITRTPTIFENYPVWS